MLLSVRTTAQYIYIYILCSRACTSEVLSVSSLSPSIHHRKEMCLPAYLPASYKGRAKCKRFNTCGSSESYPPHKNSPFTVENGETALLIFANDDFSLVPGFLPFMSRFWTELPHRKTENEMKKETSS